MRKLSFILVLLLCAYSLFAQEAEDGGMTSSRDLEIQISSLPELKLIFTQNFKFPFFPGDNPLTSGNNINLAVGGEITPVSANLLGELVWTPIAFFQLSVGGRLGSGWPFYLFGDDPLKGVGINQPDSEGKMEYSGSGFDGALYSAFVGGMIQMDFGLLLPWEYDHIVFQSYHEINYEGYSRAKGSQSWYYEADGGENVNGFNYYGSILLGYQIPNFFLNTIACLAEMDLYLNRPDVPGRDIWGDDLIRWHIAAVLGFTITANLDVKIVTQFRTLRYFEDDSTPAWRGMSISGNPKDYYYRNRTLDTSNPTGFHFYRVAALITISLP